MASLTDLALGLVTVVLARRLPRGGDASRYWHAAFWWAAATALAGAVQHGFLVGIPRVGAISWAVTSSMVVVVMTFLLAATVVEVLGRRRAVLFWPMRAVGLLAYGVLAATGHPSVTAILWCESLTVACVLGLWTWALLRGHPTARPMLVAIAVSIGAGLLRLVPAASAALRLDPDSAYHLGQIAGMLLLFVAVSGSIRREVAQAGPVSS
jgi:hypothetical protein